MTELKLANQPLLFKCKNELNGKLVEAIRAFKDIEALHNYVEAIYEHYDAGSTVIQEADLFIEPVRKKNDKVKRSHFFENSKNFEKRGC